MKINGKPKVRLFFECKCSIERNASKQMINREAELLEIIQCDEWMMHILKTVEKVRLNDCWVCAGFIRNKVWDFLHGYTDRTPLDDIDIIYFDKTNLSEKQEKYIEDNLFLSDPDIPWSVKNQARMHEINNFKPYKSSYDSIAHFPEIPTAVGVRIHKGKLEIIAPYGLESLFSKSVVPTPFFKESTVLHQIYIKRINTKKWSVLWPQLKIHDCF